MCCPISPPIRAFASRDEVGCYFASHQLVAATHYRWRESNTTRACTTTRVHKRAWTERWITERSTGGQQSVLRTETITVVMRSLCSLGRIYLCVSSAPGPVLASELQRQSVCKPPGDASSEQQIAVTNVVIARSTDSVFIAQSKTRSRVLKIKLRDRRRVEAGTLGGLRLQGCRRLAGTIGGLGAAEAGKRGSAGAGRSIATWERAARS